MKNIFSIPEYNGVFNASKISHVRYEKAYRSFYLSGMDSQKIERNGRRYFVWIKNEPLYILKYAVHKIFGTPKPRAELTLAGYWQPSTLVISFNGRESMEFEFKGSEEFYYELVAFLASQKFTFKDESK